TEDDQTDTSFLRKFQDGFVDRPELRSESPVVRKRAGCILPEIGFKFTLPLFGGRVARSFGNVDYGQASSMLSSQGFGVACRSRRLFGKVGGIENVPHSRIRRGVVRSAWTHRQDRAGRMPKNAFGDRTESEFSQPGSATGAHHQHVHVFFLHDSLDLLPDFALADLDLVLNAAQSA